MDSPTVRQVADDAAYYPRCSPHSNLGSSMSFPSREESSSGENSAGRGRRNFSQHLRPLQVTNSSQSIASQSEGLSQYSVPNSSKNPRAGGPLSPDSEKMLVRRIEELSKLDSPVLRELSRRLGARFKIHTPPYDPAKRMGHPYKDLQIGERWQEIQGANLWAGLLDPIDPALRAEIVRYGEFAGATYDAFDGNPRSQYCGSSKYTKACLLEKVGLENRGYEITRFLYSTAELHVPNFFNRPVVDNPWSKDSNWMGFVAVCTSPEEIRRLGRRDIVVAWRGTVTKFEWISDLHDYMAPAGFDPRQDDVMVESGFLSVYKSANEKSRYNKKSAREQVLGAVRSLVDTYRHEDLSITVIGHSLGSALATLCAYDIAESGMNLKRTSPNVPNHWYVPSRKPISDQSQPQEISLYSQIPPKREEYSENVVREQIRDYLEKIDEGADKLADSLRGHLSVGSADSVHGVSDSVSTSDSSSFKFRSARLENDSVPVTVMSFAGPRVGNIAFGQRMEDLGVAVLRVVNVNDYVPTVPGIDLIAKPMRLLHKVANFVPSYRHVGVELKVDNLKSPYLKETTNPLITHDLEGYLHLVDGYHASDASFEPTLRDYALANKKCDFLRPELFIPGSWWQEENKGLTRDDDGHWVVPRRAPDLFPATPTSAGDDFGFSGPETPLERGDRSGFYRSVSIALERSNTLDMQRSSDTDPFESPQ